jgi:signal transduction histidine kinase
MNWMSIVWPMVTAACVTMGLIHLRTGLRRKAGAAYLLFSLNAFVVATYSVFELALTHAGSPAQYLARLRWLDIMAGAQVVTTAAFVWVFFGVGRRWLAWLASSVTCVAVIADLLPVPKLVFLQLNGIRSVPTFGGDAYVLADGVRNPWNAVFYVGVLLLVVFVADASAALWRRGARRRAAVVGGSITFFVLAAGVQASSVDTGVLRTPYLVSFAYLAILIAMGAELSDDLLRAAQLAQDLRESEQRLALAAAAAQDLAGRLIGVHEDERRRLAGALHDGLSQSMALLAVELEMVGQHPPNAPGQIKSRMDELSAQVKALSADVHRLSYTLHPAKLEQLGLATATAGFCREVEQAHQIAVQCSCQNVSRWLPPDVALSLYRVVQEALQNVVKHSGAKSATVELRAADGEIQLNVADTGKGFDTGAVNKGLGLVSMRERVRLVSGQIHWRSQPGHGTHVYVRVPLPAAGATG